MVFHTLCRVDCLDNEDETHSGSIEKFSVQQLSFTPLPIIGDLPVQILVFHSLYFNSGLS